MFYYPRDDDFGKKRDKVDWISWISTNYAVFIFSLQTSAEIFENLWSPDIANKAAATRGYHDFDDCCLLSTLSRTDVIKHLQFWIGILIGSTFFQSIFFFLIIKEWKTWKTKKDRSVMFVTIKTTWVRSVSGNFNESLWEKKTCPRVHHIIKWNIKEGPRKKKETNGFIYKWERNLL